MFLLLTPHDHARLTADYLKAFPLPTDIDLIEAITGKPNLTHAWNKFRLRAEVVESILGLS